MKIPVLDYINDTMQYNHNMIDKIVAAGGDFEDVYCAAQAVLATLLSEYLDTSLKMLPREKCFINLEALLLSKYEHIVKMQYLGQFKKGDNLQ